MIPNIGLMVMTVGLVVCAYVLGQALRHAERPEMGSGTRVVFYLIAVASLAGAGGLAVLGADLYEAGRQAPRRFSPAELRAAPAEAP